jgi:hypothetical protein
MTARRDTVKIALEMRLVADVSVDIKADGPCQGRSV